MPEASELIATARKWAAGKGVVVSPQSIVITLADQLAAAQKRNAALVAMLRKVESKMWHAGSYCWFCGEDYSHGDDCKLAALLKEVGDGTA